MSKDKYIIICGGECKRWNNYGGIPKHLVDIDGETLLHRTVRLLGDKDITVVVRDGKDDRYNVKPAKIANANLNKDNFSADKFLSSKDLWNKNGRTIILYGDVYFTEQALQEVMEYNNREWMLFARPFGSKLTGCPYPECFAQSFYPEDHEEHLSALYKIRDLKRSGKMTRCGGWEHYKVMCGGDPSKIKEIILSERIKIIDDYTEDFDKPSDYDMWKYSIKNEGVVWQYIKAKDKKELHEKAKSISQGNKVTLKKMNYIS